MSGLFTCNHNCRGSAILIVAEQFAPAFINQLLKLEREQIIEAVQNVIVPQFDKGTVIVFAGQEQLEKANKEFAAEGKPPLLIEGILRWLALVGQDLTRLML